MMSRVAQRLLQISLDKAYRVANLEALGDTLLGFHSIWQGPLLAPDLSELPEAVVHAGELWLRNFDLTHHNRLVIWHQIDGWSYCFMRAMFPSQPNLTLGPLKDPVYSEGSQVQKLDLRFLEFSV